MLLLSAVLLPKKYNGGGGLQGKVTWGTRRGRRGGVLQFV